jgi:non-specific serine/threonine protein kinase/serine/threonine-protein kinase
MGIVYLAEQAEPIKRQVALKVIKPGMDSQRVVARFEAERQALALLDHPNIAHVYDAGTTEAGRPYFVMEHVEGLPITEYCDRHKLTIEQRLRLFQQVCLAVHHAHQKGIIHRDLKPSNILVSAEDDHPIPKIIDFGVAKAISQPLTERTSLTEDSQLLGTPEYMSPEQANLANEDIDTRSDIYSLGVLLYVLLAGILPYDSETFRQGGIEHIRKTIRETDPKTPSTRLTKLGEGAKRLAENRCSEVAILAKRLHRELEWIPLKAMRKERAERYRSASELADDIDNYLKGAPLIAGPPGTVYRLSKAIHRHKVIVGGILAVLTVSVIGAIVSLGFAIGQARARAEAQAIADYLHKDVLMPMARVQRRQLRASDILDVATQNLEGKFKDHPLIEASIRETLGSIYLWGLNDYSAAELHLEHAHQIRREQLGAGNPPTNALGALYYLQGNYKEAEFAYDRLLEVERRRGASELSLVYPRCNLACVYAAQGRYEEAENLFVETQEIARLGERPSWAQAYDFELAEVYRAQGQNAKAERLYTAGMLRRSTGDRAVDLRYLCGLAHLRMAQGHYDDANDLLVKACAAADKQLGEEHPFTLRFTNSLGVLRREQQRYKEAESLIRQALEGRQRKLGPHHPHTLESVHELGVLHIRQSRHEDAEPLLLAAFHGRQTKLGPEHPHTIASLNELVRLYESWPKPDEAEKWRAKLPQRETVEE